jgi:hypothetical protein
MWTTWLHLTMVQPEPEPDPEAGKTRGMLWVSHRGRLVRAPDPAALARQVRGHLLGDDSVVDLSLGLGVVRGTPAPYHR